MDTTESRGGLPERAQMPERRALLSLGIAAAVTAVGSFAAAEDAQAAAGGVLLLGTANSSGSKTTTVTTSSGTGISANGPAGGAKGTATGTGTSNAGVKGTAKSTANYGVMSNGKVGVNGPVELAAVTIGNYAGPGSGKSYLYVKTITGGVALRFKTPTGDVLVTSG